MAEFERADLDGTRFTEVRLRGAVFTEVDLSGARIRESAPGGVVLRGVDVDEAEIDAPWLYDGRLIVNDVDVVPLVEAELNRHFPGRSERRGADPVALRSAWSALELAWKGVLARVADLPPGCADRSVDEEWSFAQTLRHLVLATDLWFGRAVLRREHPFHPLGLVDPASAGEFDADVFSTGQPSYSEVLVARAERLTMVRDFLATMTDDDLSEERANPHSPDHTETVLSCLHTILEEEWGHLRYAVRDLDRIAASPDR